MERSPSWEANRSSDCQDIPCTLWNPKVYYCIHKYQSPLPILSQYNTVHPSPSHFLMIHFISIIPYTTRPSKWTLSIRSSHQNPVCTCLVPHMWHMPCPSHASWFDLLINIWWWVESVQLLTLWSSHLPCYLVPLSPYIFPQHLLNTLSLCSSLNVRNQTLDPYKIRGKITILCFLIFMFLDSKLEDKRFFTKW